jgi:hypothetical protein
MTTLIVILNEVKDPGFIGVHLWLNLPGPALAGQ